MKKSYGQSIPPTAGDDTSPSPSPDLGTALWSSTNGVALESPSSAIKHLEASLAVLPEGDLYKVPREAISARIADLKRSITQSKPLPAQFASASAALDRAIARRTKAAEAIENAALELCAAEGAVSGLESEVRRIEGDISNSSLGSASNASDSIQSLATSLSSGIGEMKVSNNS